MTVPGLGGQQQPALTAATAAALVPGITPGSSSPVVRAQVVIVYGPAGAAVGVFVYTAGTTPALGNPPIVAITNQTTDPFGNSVQPSDSPATSAQFIVLGTGGSYLQAAVQSGLASLLVGTGDSAETFPAFIDATIAGTGGTRRAVLEAESPILSGNNPASVQLFSASEDGTVGDQISLNASNLVYLGVSQNCWWSDAATQFLFAVAGSGPFLNGEGWHDVSGGSGNTARVKMLPWNMVALDVQASWSGTGTTTMGSLPSAAYYPVQARQFAVASNATPAQNARVFVPTSGAIELVVSGGSSNGQGGACVTYPTN